MNKKILIIGASRGLGKKCAEYFANISGYSILSPTSGELNLLNFEQTREYVEKNTPDIIFNFAVKNLDSALHKISSDIISEMKDAVELGTTAQLNLVSSALKSMRKNKFGRIVLFSSVVTNNLVFGTAAYASSKAFVEQLAKNLGKENAKLGITCNVVRLGYTEEGLISKVPGDLLEGIVETIPASRLCRADELNCLLKTIIEIEYLNGATISLTGGL